MRRPVLAGLLLAVLWAPLPAQVRGLPIAAGSAPPGFGVSLDMGFPGDALGGGTAWAASLAFRQGRFGISGTRALVDHASADAQAAFGARGELLLARSATSPFQLLGFAGAGTMELDGSGREWRIPAGMSFAFRAPTPVATFVSWLSARAQWTVLDGSTEVGPGFGAGIDVTWRERYGVRAAYDRLLRDGSDETTFGLGLTYTFTPGH
jgi:hypothetical protein